MLNLCFLCIRSTTWICNQQCWARVHDASTEIDSNTESTFLAREHILLVADSLHQMIQMQAEHAICVFLAYGRPRGFVTDCDRPGDATKDNR